MASQQDLPRTVLPIPDREAQGLTTFDAKDPDTHYPPIQQLRPPAGAPNVLVVLLCSPTRAALLSGRNHHSVGFGAITEMATSAPGNNSLRPNTCAPLAEVLKLNGYATAQFGKCHEVPVWETSPVRPFNSWPSGGGGTDRQARRSRVLQPLRRRLGQCHVHALPMDQTGGLPFWRYPQWHHRALARWDQCRG